MHPVIVEEHGVVAVDMPATEEQHLASLVNHLPVREISALRFVGGSQTGFTVERQGQIHLPGKLKQA